MPAITPPSPLGESAIGLEKEQVTETSVRFTVPRHGSDPKKKEFGLNKQELFPMHLVLIARTELEELQLPAARSCDAHEPVELPKLANRTLEIMPHPHERNT